jgi:hypothetical protein
MVHVHRDYLDKSKFDFKKMFAETDKEKMKQLVLVLGVLFEVIYGFYYVLIPIQPILIEKKPA